MEHKVDFTGGPRKDYRITIKARNANILRAIESAGEVPGNKFAEKIGVSYYALNGFINCKLSPLNNDGDYKHSILKLCEYLNKMPSELFSHEQIEPLANNRADVDVTFDQCAALSQNVATTGSLEYMENMEEKSALYDAMNNLTGREQEVLDMRFGLSGEEYTLDEVGERLGVSKERIRQIEAKAQRKLRCWARHPALPGKRFICDR